MENIHISLHNVANVANRDIQTLIRATVKMTGVDVSRLPRKPDRELYTIKAAFIWVGVYLVTVRAVDIHRHLGFPKSSICENIQSANVARTLQSDVGYIEYALFITLVPKIYAEFCRLKMVGSE